MKILNLIFVLIISVFILIDNTLIAQVKNIGTPRIRNFESQQLKAGTQTWMIDVAPSGLIYFANNEGVLEFDGQKWRKYPLAQRSVVRSVKVASDGKIFAGGHNEFGYFETNLNGSLQLRSLQHLVSKEKQDFGEVWRIFEMPYGIVFQTFSQLMIYKNESISVIDAPEQFHFSYVVDNQLYVNDQKFGLYKIIDQKLVKLKGTEMLNGELIWAMLPLGNQLLISTADKGMY